jgi:hypothetical protein
MSAGFVLMASPFVFSFGSASMVTAVIVGAGMVGLALSAASGAEGRGTMPSSAHAAYDIGLAAGLVIAGIALGFAGDPAATAVFTGVALFEVLVSVNTKYSLARA